MPKITYPQPKQLVPEHYPHNNIIQYFEYEDLPERLQSICKPLCDTAKMMDRCLMDGAEKRAGLRKLLEAKDCFVRAHLELFKQD